MTYIADWTKRENYPTDDADPQTWAFEFLRRNVEYCKDWDYLAAQVRAAGATALLPSAAIYAEYFLTGSDEDDSRIDDAFQSKFGLTAPQFSGDLLQASSDVLNAHREHTVLLSAYRSAAYKSLLDTRNGIMPTSINIDNLGTNEAVLQRFPYRTGNLATNSLKLLGEAMGKRWGLGRMYSPHHEFRPSISSGGFLLQHGDGAEDLTHDLSYLKTLSGKELTNRALYIVQDLAKKFGNLNKMIVSFDLSLPTEPQLAQVKRAIEKKLTDSKHLAKLEANGIHPEAQAFVDKEIADRRMSKISIQPIKRNESTHYCNYLRVWDARVQKATFKTIGDTLIPKHMPKRGDADQVSQITKLKVWCAAAKRLITDDFLAVALTKREFIKQPSVSKKPLSRRKNNNAKRPVKALK